MIGGQLETVPMRIGKCSAIMWILWKEYHHFLYRNTGNSGYVNIISVVNIYKIIQCTGIMWIVSQNGLIAQEY